MPRAQGSSMDHAAVALRLIPTAWQHASPVLSQDLDSMILVGTSMLEYLIL